MPILLLNFHRLMERKSECYKTIEPCIAKVNYPIQGVIGYMVRWFSDGHGRSLMFSRSKFDTWEAALRAAREFKSNLLEQGKPKLITRKDWATKVRRRTSTGIVGVQYSFLKHGNSYCEYFTAVWSPRPGERRKRSFSVAKYGFNAAKSMAVRTRKEGIASMQDADMSIRPAGRLTKEKVVKQR
jgi:hypothetical protein